MPLNVILYIAYVVFMTVRTFKRFRVTYIGEKEEVYKKKKKFSYSPTNTGVA